MSNQKPGHRNQSKKKGLIFVISGPSGSGKTTLLKKLLQAKGFARYLAKSVSFTTRPKRSGERNGKDYFFITKSEFRKKQALKKILEWTKYLGYYYATPKDLFERHLRAGRNMALCLDLKGALKIKRLYPGNTVLIFVLAPSLVVLRQRISSRCSRTRQEEVTQRMELARGELAGQNKYDYTIVNKDLSQAVQCLKEIIVKETQARIILTRSGKA